jgi:hypothetical protein
MSAPPATAQSSMLTAICRFAPNNNDVSTAILFCLTEMF